MKKFKILVFNEQEESYELPGKVVSIIVDDNDELLLSSVPFNGSRSLVVRHSLQIRVIENGTKRPVEVPAGFGQVVRVEVKNNAKETSQMFNNHLNLN